MLSKTQIQNVPEMKYYGRLRMIRAYLEIFDKGRVYKQKFYFTTRLIVFSYTP